MRVVIFRAQIAQLDAAYSTLAAELRERALRDFGCLEFVAVSEGNDEIALSYWPDDASIQAWKADADHRMAQHYGRERWYTAYRVEITTLERRYGTL